MDPGDTAVPPQGEVQVGDVAEPDQRFGIGSHGGEVEVVCDPVAVAVHRVLTDIDDQSPALQRPHGLGEHLLARETRERNETNPVSRTNTRGLYDVHHDDSASPSGSWGDLWGLPWKGGSCPLAST